VSWRYRSAHVMDKMNLFGMPFRRLVWVDADMFLRRNVDDICDLPEEVPFASALDAEGLPTRCWPKHNGCPGNCSRTYNLKGDGHDYVALRVPELSPAPSRCPYVLQSGVMMLQPLNLTAFNTLIVGPVANGRISTYDGGDQGIITTLVYGKTRMFGDSYMRLHPKYNVIARHAKHTEVKWGVYNQNKLSASLLHFTRETRPWQSGPRIDNVTRVAEWTTHCGHVVCRSLHHDKLRRQERKAANVSKTTQMQLHEGATHVAPPAIGISGAWDAFCNKSSRKSHIA
jgi:hypothetical protein